MSKQAFHKLEQAAEQFIQAIHEFSEQHELETVGLNEWIENIMDTVSDINEEVNGDLD